MTKKEAEKLLYVFLKRHKLAEKYYYYCVVYNERRSHGRENYLSLPRKEYLKKIMDEHCDWFLNGQVAHDLDGFFNFREHSFAWDKTPEGYNYWEDWFYKWEKEMGNRLWREHITNNE